ncbi:hypothetical protein BB559_005086 [Furculomyces boomerangus]|uniref:Uncharacterized protein n=2 Tax=Harpellales TaxID=61421 RepID=A0A2T9YAX7_9FUNG|nr:hypothetical protein BB559_005086 [Furculomyces boomerangus]PWA01129.1 hypothetical protein BB558_002790 [Smittium angustum]
MLGKIKTVLGLIFMTAVSLVYSDEHYIGGILSNTGLNNGKVHLVLKYDGKIVFDVLEKPQKVFDDCRKDCVYEITFGEHNSFRFNSEGVYFTYNGHLFNLNYINNRLSQRCTDIEVCKHYRFTFSGKF